MKLNEHQIFEYSLNQSLPKENLSTDLQNAYSHYFESLTQPIKLGKTVFGDQGVNLASWINPMQFDENYNSAVSALEAIDAMETQELSIQSYILTTNFYDAFFKSNRELYGDNYNRQNEILDNDNINYLRNGINFRKVKRCLDLIEYVKACEFGMKNLYSIDTKPLTLPLSVSKIRNYLRALLEKMKELDLKTKTSTLSISAKYSTIDFNKKERRVVEQLSRYPRNTKNNNSRDEILTGIHRGTNIIFDLSNHHIFKKLDNHWLENIGIEIIDDSTVRLFKGFQVSDRSKYYWTVSMTDGGKTVDEKKDKKLENLYEIQPTLFFNVPGGKGKNPIYSTNKTLENVNMERKWILKIEGDNINSNSHILDIILHFKFRYTDKTKILDK